MKKKWVEVERTSTMVMVQEVSDAKDPSEIREEAYRKSVRNWNVFMLKCLLGVSLFGGGIIYLLNF